MKPVTNTTSTPGTAPWGIWLLSLHTGHWNDHLRKSPHNYKKTQTQSDIEESGAPSKYYGGCNPPLWVIVAIWFFDRFSAPSDSSAATSVCNSANKCSRARQLWPHMARTSKSSGLKSGLNRPLLTQLQDSSTSCTCRFHGEATKTILLALPLGITNLLLLEAKGQLS
jgi:hypothetical protein